MISHIHAIRDLVSFIETDTFIQDMSFLLRRQYEPQQQQEHEPNNNIW